MAFRRFYSAPDRGRFFDKEKGRSFPACVPASFITAANQMNCFLSSASSTSDSAYSTSGTGMSLCAVTRQ